MRKEVFEEGQYYHVYARGVDKRTVFLSDRERYRFIHTLYVLNNFLHVPRRFDLVALHPRELLTPIKQPYVDIVAGCLMPNHYHLMLTPNIKGGVSQFMQKVGSSYAHYFNLKHQRKGRLFESTFHAKHVDSHEYAAYLTQYIHFNPVKLFSSRSKIWTKGKERSDLDTLEEYKWSSFPVYLGENSPFSLIVSEGFRNGVLDMNAQSYRDFASELMKEDENSPVQILDLDRGIDTKEKT